MSGAPISGLDASDLDELRRRAATVKSIRSRFVQETRIPMFARPMRSEGRFLFLRPDMLLWEYTAPMEEGFFLRGDNGIRWNDGRASARPFNPASDPVAAIIARQLFAWITVDTEAIAGEYGIEALSREPLALKMTPLRDDVAAVIESITITFTAEGPASLVELRERAGGTTTIGFTESVVNGPMADGDFE